MTMRYVQIVGLGLLLACCAGCQSKVLRYEDLARPIVTYEQGKLSVEGTVMHSSLGVRDTKVIEDDDTLFIKSYLDMSHASPYIRYCICIDVPKKINEVRFGNDGTLIWKRRLGPVR